MIQFFPVAKVPWPFGPTYCEVCIIDWEFATSVFKIRKKKSRILLNLKFVKIRANSFTRLCKRLLVIMLNCWLVNESWTVDVIYFVIHKFSAICLRRKVCWNSAAIQRGNLNFKNFKIDSFKISKNSSILGNFIIRKIRFFNLWSVFTAVVRLFPRCHSLQIVVNTD